MHYFTMDRASLRLLEQARERLIESVAELRTEGAHEPVTVVSEVLSHVLPNLPGMIETRLPQADAQIFTRAQLQSLLAQFAADVLAVQSDCLLEAIRKD